MPIIEAHFLKGYDQGTRTRLSHGLTDALRMVIPAPPESITIVLHELERDNYMRGGALRRREDPLPDPRDVIRRFNTAMMAGDFEAAEALVTDDCVFRLSGGGLASRPDEVASFTAGHWSEFSMTVESADICAGPAGAIIYERVVINGVASNGDKIVNLRSAIRFEFRGPLICEFETLTNHPLFPPEGT